MTMAAVRSETEVKARGRKRRSLADNVVATMVRDGLLPFAVKLGSLEAVSLSCFLRDLHARWGSSGSLSAVDPSRDYVAGGKASWPAACSTDAMARADRVLSRLQDHERGLLQWLENSRGRINVNLALLGREWCHGSDDRDSAQRATGVMQSLARSVAEHYPHQSLVIFGQAGLRKQKLRPLT